MSQLNLNIGNIKQMNELAGRQAKLFEAMLSNVENAHSVLDDLAHDIAEVVEVLNKTQGLTGRIIVIGNEAKERGIDQMELSPEDLSELDKLHSRFITISQSIESDFARYVEANENINNAGK